MNDLEVSKKKEKPPQKKISIQHTLMKSREEKREREREREGGGGEREG